MILQQSIDQYRIYIQALGLSGKRLSSYQRVLTDIELFYGPDTPLESFDNSLVLEYVKENDPFETDPLKVERGTVFCKFTHWLMVNRLIPAWAEEMKKIESDHSC
jgi:hypothetical protein